MVCAKGLANGFPLSAVVSRKELMDKQAPGTVGGTYAGNAVACAAAVAVTEVMEEEKILENVAARFVQPHLAFLGGWMNVICRSKQLFEGLKRIQKEDASGSIVEVRGLGLMVGVEFVGSSQDYVVNESVPKKLASKVTARCLQKGLLLLPTSVFEVVRFIPPLNVSDADMAKGIAIFSEAFREVVSGR